MDLSKLKSAEQSEKLELYESLIKNIYDLQKKENAQMDEKDLGLFLSEISKDLLDESQLFVGSLLKQLKFLMESNETTKCFLSEDQKRSIVKNIISVLKVNHDDHVLLLCLEHLEALLAVVKLADDVIIELLNRVSEIASKKSVSVPLYLAVCIYIQKFFNEYKDKLTGIMHIVPKLIFPPLCHSMAKVREVAEKTVDDFPKLLLYAENEALSSVLLKLVKDTYCKDLLVLFKEKQEIYVLKVWKHIVNALGKSLHHNLPAMTPLFQLIERGFKSTCDDICKTSFLSWKCLISNFALDEAVLNDSKKLRFVLKPFKNLSKFNETISLAVCDTWWHLAWSLSDNLSSRFTEVCIPLLEFTVGKISAGPIEKAVSKATQLFLAKRGCHFILRLLEQPPNAAFSRISSPKKLPSMLYPTLQGPLDPKVIIRHSKEIMSMVRTIIETFGNSKEMTGHLDSLLKSVLFIVSTVIEDRNKESIEAVILLITLVSDITESRKCPPLTCLKCIDSLSKLPRSILVSHCFNCGPRKPQDILCTTLLKLLLNPYLFDMETPKKFLMAYNRLIQTGLCESLNPLLMTQKYIHIVKTAVLPENTESEILYEIWSGIASPLLESIEKTQEVNQGDKQDHDFSCLYDVLLCPFEHNFPLPVHQLRTKPAFRLWTNLYKSFIRSSSLVTTVFPNEACEQFCARLKNYFKDDLLKEPQYFEVVCFLLEVVIDSVDFASVGAANSQGFTNRSLLVKRKKPLGNLTSLVDLLTLLLNLFYSNYIDIDEDSYHSCAPKAQRKGHISKTGVPFDLVKSFLGNLKSGSIIPFVLGEFVPSLSKFFSINHKKCTNTMGTKLEDLWNVVASSIEIHYLGPYDLDFLAMMNPLLELCISHPRRLVKERSRRFWFATFAPSASALKIPESFKMVLKKSKLSLAPEENISSLEEISFTPDAASLENGVLNFESAVSFKEPFSKSFAVVSPKETKPSESKPVKSNNAASTKKSVDELPSSEFVTIDSPGPSSLTPRRRSIRHRKSFVPALYNDLSQSQDTTTLGGSSESFDISSSCEIIEFKSQEAGIAKTTTPIEQKIDSHDEEIVATIGSENDIELQQSGSLEIITDASKIVTSSQNGCNSLNEIFIEKEIQVGDKNENDAGQVKGKSEREIGKVNDKKERYIEEVKDNIEDILQVKDKNEKNIQLSALEVNHIQELANPPDLQCLNEESEAKESIEEILFKVSGAAESLPASSSAGLKRSDRVRQKKRNANENENLQSTNVKRKNLSDVSTEPIKVADAAKNIKSFSESINTLEKLINKSDAVEICLNSDSGVQGVSGQTVHIGAKPTVKMSKACSKKVSKKRKSDSFAFETGKNLLDQSFVFKPNQTCPEIIDLSDSEEIIPSSQSSGENVNYKKPQTPEAVTKKSSGPRRSLKFDSFAGKTGTPETFTSITTPSDEATFPEEVIPMIVEDTNEAECPETPLDLIGKETLDVPKEECTSITKDSEHMPLKSSENLLSCEDLNNKPDSADVKNALSTVLQINEKIKLNVAENTPPFSEDICVLQSTEHVSFQSNPNIQESSEEKIASKLNDTESKLQKLEMKLPSSIGKEESPKTTRVKSLRSAGKGLTRKSMDSAMIKKIVKRTAKRKSLPCANETKKVKCDTLDSITETVSSNVDPMIDMEDLKPSDHSNPSSNTNSELGGDSQEKILHLAEPSQIVEGEKEENSFLMDITNVISDIQEKLDSYEESIIIDLGEYEEEMHKMSSKEDNLTLASIKESVSNCKFSEPGENVKTNADEIPCVASKNPFESIESSPNTDAKKELDVISADVEIKMGTSVNNYLNRKPSDVISEVDLPHVNISGSFIPSDTEYSVCLDKPPNLTLKPNASQNHDTQVKDIEAEKSCKSLLEDEPSSKSINKPCVLEQKLIEEKSTALMISLDKSAEGYRTSNEIVNNETILSTSGESLKASQVINSSEDQFKNSNELSEEETINETQFETNEIVSQKTMDAMKDNINIEKFDEQEILICSSELNPSFDKYEDHIDKQEHCVGIIAAYEEIGENPVIAFQEESSENLNFAESGEQASQNANTQILPYVKIVQHIESAAVLNENETEHIEDSPDLEINNAGENGLIQNYQEVKENGECVYDDTNDLLLVVSSEFTENLIEISDSPDDLHITDDVNANPSNSLNGTFNDEVYNIDSSLCDVDMVRETPSLLTSETFENDSDNKSDDQNNIEKVSEDKSIENCSRKRKTKRPVRSPFVFRQRSNIIVAKNLSANCEHIAMELEDCKISAKRTIQNVHKKASENGLKKQKTASKTPTAELSDNSEDIRQATEACDKAAASSKDTKKSAETVKPAKAVNYDEMTNLNTRLNASMTFHTRRYKMIAASQKASHSEKNHNFSEEKNENFEEETSTSKTSNGILKKRKGPCDLPSSKLRKVTFADPLFEERLFKNNDSLGKCSLKSDFLVITKEQQNSNLSEDIEKIAKTSSTLALGTDEVPSSNEYQNSDNLTDYSSFPVSPLLINCEESVSNILKGLTSPAWVRGLEALLLSKNIKTIGDLCKLNVHELKALPFKSPKVICLHNALAAHLKHTQESTLEKLKAVDDWCSNLLSNGASLSDSKTSERDANSCQDEEGASENVGSEVVQSLAEELFNNDKVKKLPTETLILLAKKCFAEVTDRLQNS